MPKKVAFADHALGPYTAASDAFTAVYTEGPAAIKAGNDWLIYFDAYRDKKYGAETNPIRRIALHATSLRFPHPVTGEMMSFQSPLPGDLGELV